MSMRIIIMHGSVAVNMRSRLCRSHGGIIPASIRSSVRFNNLSVKTEGKKKRNNSCRFLFVHIPQHRIEFPEVGSFPEEDNKHRCKQEKITDIGHQSTPKIMIYRKYCSLSVGIKTGLKETISFMIKYVVHINFIRRFFAFVTNLYVTFISTGRRTSGIGFHHEIIKF